MYVSNGAALAVSLRSRPELRVPDLFCMALLAEFKGYFPGYSRIIAERHDYLTWAVLKAHTNNRAGEVTLRSADPRDTPLVNFHYFEEGSDVRRGFEGGGDRTPLCSADDAGIEADGLIKQEELPGEAVQTDEQLADYVRNNAWGHHASCSCAIGPREAAACSTAGCACMALSVCALSTPRCSRAFRASSSSARCTWWQRRRQI